MLTKTRKVSITTFSARKTTSSPYHSIPYIQCPTIISHQLPLTQPRPPCLAETVTWPPIVRPKYTNHFHLFQLNPVLICWYRIGQQLNLKREADYRLAGTATEWVTLAAYDTGAGASDPKTNKQVVYSVQLAGSVRTYTFNTFGKLEELKFVISCVSRRSRFPF